MLVHTRAHRGTFQRCDVETGTAAHIVVSVCSAQANTAETLDAAVEMKSLASAVLHALRPYALLQQWPACKGVDETPVFV